MDRVPVKRLLVYVGLIAGLAGLIFAESSGRLPSSRNGGAAVFKPPVDPTVDLEKLAALDADRMQAKDGDRQNADQFEDELRMLAAQSDGVGGDGVAAAGATPSPTPQATPTPTKAPATPASDGAGLGADDARRIFSGLEGEEGSKVEDILPGVVARGPGLGDLVGTPSATPSAQRGWVRGQARGYTMLYAMQPQARPVVEANVQALLSSRVREPYIGVLIDGTFGRDFNYLKEIITRLSDDDRDLTVALYLSNGPTMRKWKETPIDEHIFARISPLEFREQIRWNMRLKAEFLAVAIQAKDVFNHNTSLNPGNSNVAIVMLEDNLDALSYRALREIGAEQVGSIAGFIRNPCVGCGVEGSDDNTLGDPREEHAIDRFAILKQGDAYSLDGVGFRYPNSSGDGVSPEQLDSMLKASVERRLRYFGLWRHEWQGVIEGVPNRRPQERNFIASNQDQLGFEIQALRTGLLEEAPPEEESRPTSP
jgi:hypothetical protein